MPCGYSQSLTSSFCVGQIFHSLKAMLGIHKFS